MKIRNKDDIVMEVAEETTNEQFRQLGEMLEKSAKENGVQIENSYHYFSFDGMLIYQNNKFVFTETSKNYMSKDFKDPLGAYYITLEDFNRVCHLQEKLDVNQLFFLSNGEFEGMKEFMVGDKTYEVVNHYSDTVFTNGKNRKAFREIYIVTKDIEAAEQLVQRINMNYMYARTSKIIVNIKGKLEDCVCFGKEIRSKYDDIAESYGIMNIYIDRASGYSIYGGLLFMGAFFTILFLCATVLIIYFKQISEGFEDKDRFEMLQMVGMDDSEVKKTINKQILIVFFLPLFGALLHVAMASKMIIKLMEVFWLYNIQLTVLCVISSCTIFTLVYVIVYRLTARTYCRIVKG